MKKRIKIICICGARPNFIKIAPLAEEFRKNKNVDFIIVHTGQHYDFEMSEIFFKDLSIPKPNYNLGIGSGSHSFQVAKAMIELERIFLKENPDLAIALGDVNSTLAGALTAAKLNVKVCHIEAGLRSYDKSMPEEVNRVLTDHISDLLFCPTKTAVDNLKREGIKKGVYNTGDIMYDVFLKSIKEAEKKSVILKNLDIHPKDYMLLTIHRASNTDNFKNLKTILEAVKESGEKIIFPCHPRTRNRLKTINISEFKNIKIINSLGYFDMLVLEKNSKKIITDSGGIQREAYWLKIPCIILRNNTEWVEIIKEKWGVLAGSDKEKILKAIKSFDCKGKQKKYFGSGKSVKKIAAVINGKFF